MPTQHDGFLRERLPFINSLTKYPSIPCWHPMGDRGVMADEPLKAPGGPYIVTEKIDGCNARIILGARCYLIGSREELLTHSGDIVHNPSQGIVDAVRAIADRLLDRAWRGLTVIYGEVYGGKVGANAKNYGPDANFRVFDAIELLPDDIDQLESLTPSQLAHWRDTDRGRFAYHDRLVEMCDDLKLDMVPRCHNDCPPPPSQDFILPWMSSTYTTDGFAAFDSSKCEGVVIRTPDRSFIAKIRREDYERAARRSRR